MKMFLQHELSTVNCQLSLSTVNCHCQLSTVNCHCQLHALCCNLMTAVETLSLKSVMFFFLKIFVFIYYFNTQRKLKLDVLKYKENVARRPKTNHEAYYVTRPPQTKNDCKLLLVIIKD